MKKIILCLFYSLLFCQLMQAQKTKQLRYVPPLSTDSSFTKGSYECEVLQLTNQNRSTGIMIVLVEKREEKMHRSQLRSNYLFKRERMYLRTVFFAEVEVLERIHVVTDVSALLQRLKKIITSRNYGVCFVQMLFSVLLLSVREIFTLYIVDVLLHSAGNLFMKG